MGDLHRRVTDPRGTRRRRVVREGSAPAIAPQSHKGDAANTAGRAAGCRDQLTWFRNVRDKAGLDFGVGRRIATGPVRGSTCVICSPSCQQMHGGWTIPSTTRRMRHGRDQGQARDRDGMPDAPSAGQHIRGDHGPRSGRSAIIRLGRIGSGLPASSRERSANRAIAYRCRETRRHSVRAAHLGGLRVSSGDEIMRSNSDGVSSGWSRPYRARRSDGSRFWTGCDHRSGLPWCVE